MCRSIRYLYFAESSVTIMSPTSRELPSRRDDQGLKVRPSKYNLKTDYVEGRN